MTRRDRLRRVVILCASFGRNLAYYRAGQCNLATPLLAKSNLHSSFWRQSNGNFLDVCVLEYCKLFGDPKGQHCWRVVVTDPTAFEVGLLAHLAAPADDFNDSINEMRRYRDKFIAHLDADSEMNIPVLSSAPAAVSFYHAHIVTHEAEQGDLFGLTDTPEKFVAGYQQCLNEAKEIHMRAQA